MGFGIAAGGATLLWASATQRDAAGYFSTSPETFRSSGHALTSSVDFGTQSGSNDWVANYHLGTIRIQASVVGGAGTFVGIAPTAQVHHYLVNVSHDEVTSVRLFPFRPVYRHTFGSLTPASPAGDDIWAASAGGTGVQTVTWPTEPGKWTLVVMRSDRLSGIVAKVSVGAKVGWLVPVGIGLAIVGGLLMIGGGIMLAFGITGLANSRRPVRDGPPKPPPAYK